MVPFLRYLINLINFSIKQEMVENIEAVWWAKNRAHGQKSISLIVSLLIKKTTFIDCH